MGADKRGLTESGHTSGLRECLLEPIPECFEAAALLSAAVDAHLSGDALAAARLIKAADLRAVREFTEAGWGAGCFKRHGFISVPDAPSSLQLADRPKPRMPTPETRAGVLNRDGCHCRFCGLPVIPRDIREKLRTAYPEALSWGLTTASQHAAFQCLWLQFDHLLPNSRGGTSDTENVVITCAPCNFGRMEKTLAEARLVDPLSRSTPVRWNGFYSWDGLERVNGYLGTQSSSS